MDIWLTVVLAAGLAARLTRLITLDTITQPLRDRLRGPIAALVECPWCSSVWVAVPVGLSWWGWADQTWWQVTALIGTIAWVAGAVSGATMPRQNEVMVLGTVPLVNADEPSIGNSTELEISAEGDDVEQTVRKIVRRYFGEDEAV